MNFYGKEYKSFYQELKYGKNGVIEGFILWSSDNRYFYSTDEKLYKPPAHERIFSVYTTNDEDYLSCVARVFREAQDACEADADCNLLCFISGPSCESCMLAAAAAACAIYD